MAIIKTEILRKGKSSNEKIHLRIKLTDQHGKVFIVNNAVKWGMKKLLKLKEWLAVPGTAKYLSTVFDEEAPDADIFRFALDGYLKFSVNFVNHA